MMDTMYVLMAGMQAHKVSRRKISELALLVNAYMLESMSSFHWHQAAELPLAPQKP